MVDLVEAVTAEPRHHRLDNGQCHRGRDRRVDGVAAGAQCHQPRLGRERVIRRDGTTPPDDQRPIAAQFGGH